MPTTYTLTLRSTSPTKLTNNQMDNNFLYAEELALTAQTTANYARDGVVAADLRITALESAGISYTAVQQGGGIGQTTDAVQIGSNGSGRLKATVGTTDLGNIVFDAHLSSYATISSLGNYATTTSLASYATLSALSGYALKVASARAWANFDGTSVGTIAPRGSHNIASITKIATGVYTIAMTTALANANYSISATCSAANGFATNNIMVLGNRNSSAIPAPTTTSFVISCISATTGLASESPYIFIQVFGD